MGTFFSQRQGRSYLVEYRKVGAASERRMQRAFMVRGTKAATLLECGQKVNRSAMLFFSLEEA